MDGEELEARKVGSEDAKRSSKRKHSNRRKHSSSKRKHLRRSSAKSDEENAISSTSISADDSSSSPSSSDSDSSLSEHAHNKEKKLHSRKRLHHSSSESTSSQIDSDLRETNRKHRLRKGCEREIDRREKRHSKKDSKRKGLEKSRREEDEKRARRKRKLKKKKQEKDQKGKAGPVTDSWGKYGIIKEIDMWIKRPEFSAWLAEVKKVNLETMPAWEEKQMFKEYMEDFNTATLAKKYYDLDAYHRRKFMKAIKRGVSKQPSERTEFNDEEQRRLELKKEREIRKEAEVEALKRSMQSGMAQAMKEQAQLREEMQYQYRLGNFEAASAIQRRLDPAASGAPLK
ncbi:hypothetical protein GOP47_0014424 [Adiantum capillus-veneris]|uniref:Uncharacterized protein n=1 Tax=Adiantum capillus-veneris TaxID=13818 RepID=A0A9D4UM91_ADICA|nr:hypothetical protein GOP47_0014424 [Adiantum capillus-veneris]